MKVWEVWMEGFVTNGCSAQAEYLGSAEAATFHEACDIVAPIHYAKCYDKTRLTVWDVDYFLQVVMLSN